MPKRLLHLSVLLLAAFTMLGASSPDKRFNKLGHQLMCTCGCAELLLECNHVGCPDSPRLIAELHNQLGDTPGSSPSGGTPVSAGVSTSVALSDSAIFSFFADKYGPTVLAAPFRGGFDNVAWVMPFAFLLLGVVAVIALVSLWKRRHARLAPVRAVKPTAAATALRDRIRSETNYGE